MINQGKARPGNTMPTFSLPAVGGGEVRIGGEGGWQVAVVYRGRHCPLCRKFLKQLDGLLDGFRGVGAEVIAISADPRDRAEAEAKEEGWRFPVGYDLSQDQMRALGLYISEPRSSKETDRPFPEPGLFVTNPDGLLHILDVSNAPFARPDLQGVLDGIKVIQKENYPIRGTAA